MATRILAVFFVTVLVCALAGVAVARMPWEYAISVAAFPLGGLAAAATLHVRGQAGLLSAWSRRLVAGLGAGIVATLAYDLYRVTIRYGLQIEFDPFRVQPVFGQIITGLPSTHPVALLAGWGYHLWVGALLGMLLAALWPRGGLVVGLVFAAVLQIGRWLMYPNVFRAGLVDREFLANGVFGLLLWGAVLGLVLGLVARWRPGPE